MPNSGSRVDVQAPQEAMTTSQSQLRPACGGSTFRYAVVRGFRLRGQGCTLYVEDPTRSQSQVDFDTAPDREGADAIGRSGLKPLSVRVKIDEHGLFTCTALVRSPDGPTRVPVSEGVALALCLSGRHTVVTRST